MLKYNFYLLVITLLSSFANSNPIKDFQPRGVCPAVNAIVSLFGAASPASSYCYSYLKITPSTSTSTSTYVLTAPTHHLLPTLTYYAQISHQRRPLRL